MDRVLSCTVAALYTFFPALTSSESALLNRLYHRTLPGEGSTEAAPCHSGSNKQELTASAAGHSSVLLRSLGATCRLSSLCSFHRSSSFPFG